MKRITLLLLLLFIALPCLSQERWGRDGAWGRTEVRWGRGIEAWTLTDLDYIVDWWRIEQGIDKDGSDKVSHWYGSINGLDLAQATADNKPTWTADVINGYPAIIFDGLAAPDGDFLQGAFGAEYSQPNTIIIVCSEPDFATPSEYLIDGDELTKRHAIRARASPGLDIYTMNAGEVCRSTYPTSNSGFKIFSCVFNGTSSIFRVNGTDYSAGDDVGGQSLDGLTVGARFNGTENSDISITDILVVNAGLSTGQLQRAERWLNEHRKGIY